MDGTLAGPSKGAISLLPGDAAALTAALLAAEFPDTARRAVRGPGRLFGLESSATGPGIADCSFREVMLIKTANLALAAALDSCGAITDEEAALTWTSLQINCDTVAAPHVDNGTLGRSAIALLGDFTGGAFNIAGEEALTTKNEVRLFEGGRQSHSSEAFIGRRYSLVWHTRAKPGDLPPDAKAYLESLHFRLAPRTCTMHLKVLYCFSGPHRRASLARALYLIRSADFPHVGLEVVKVDTLNDAQVLKSWFKGTLP